MYIAMTRTVGRKMLLKSARRFKFQPQVGKNAQLLFIFLFCPALPSELGIEPRGVLPLGYIPNPSYFETQVLLGC